MLPIAVTLFDVSAVLIDTPLRGNPDTVTIVEYTTYLLPRKDDILTHFGEEWRVVAVAYDITTDEHAEVYVARINPWP